MCCTLAPAELKNTILYAADARVDGKYVHVLGYQNLATNHSPGPNAMILPFPASAPMGPDNILDVSGCRRILKDMAYSIAERSRGLTKSASTLRSAQVFESGAYTIVLAEDASDIPGALHRVPEAKRPPLNAEIFEAYSQWYPNWPIALCCFSNRASLDADPILWWYEPKEENSLFAPALDAHDGRAPNLRRNVEVDHTLIYGSCVDPHGSKVQYRDELPNRVRSLLAPSIIGRTVRQSMPNGDFTISVEKVRSARMGYSRIAPPGA